jgi:hypothetical protein
MKPKSFALITSTSVAVLLTSAALPTFSQSVQHNQPSFHLADIPAKSTLDLVEQYGFQIKNYPLDYQGLKNVLDIDVTYQYMKGITKPQYPDVVAIKKDLEKYMQSYPDKMQYWEILNKDATKMLIDKYPSISSVTIKLQIYPNEPLNFPRTSTVTRTRR